MTAESNILAIETAAHSGAFGENQLKTPTDAQAISGNYKKGRVNLHGLSIAIEQPRGTYRTGIDAKTGKRWTSRMAAHYGYFERTKGNDGDGVDCFIGFYPQSELVFVINQFVKGSFDEHKVMLCYPDEDSAKKAYLDSYERGWNGLHSIIQLSATQLKWWLKHGNMRTPLNIENLPPEGLETMTRRLQWNSDALPYDQTLDQVLYDIRRADDDGLLLDAVSLNDILEEAEGVMTFDAMVTPYAKLQRKMELLNTVLERTGEAVKPVSMQISDPFKQNGTAQVAVVFELSDGQTVSIYLHNPDVTPAKIAPQDELISWKWLLNKKDISIVVAPERGEDLNVREVARRIMKLAEKNSAAFQKANGKRAERMTLIATVKEEIVTLEAELKAAQNELEVAKVEAESRPVIDWTKAEHLDSQESIRALGVATINDVGNENVYVVKGGKPYYFKPVNTDNYAVGEHDFSNDSPYGETELPATHYSYIILSNLVENFGWERSEGTGSVKKNVGGGVTGGELNPAGVRTVTAIFDEPARRYLTLQSGWDNVFSLDCRDKDPKEAAEEFDSKVRDWANGSADKGVAVKEADIDPTTPEGYAKILADKSLQEKYQDGLDSLFQSRIVGVRNALRAIAGWDYGLQPLHSNEDIYKNGAIKADFKFTYAGAGRNVVGYSVNGIVDDLTKTPEQLAAEIDALAGGNSTPTEQDLINAYVKSWGVAADKIRAAVETIQWNRIVDERTASFEDKALSLAVRDVTDMADAKIPLTNIGIESWDNKLAFVSETPERKSYTDAMDSYRAASDKIRAVAKEKLIEAGKAEFAALNANSSIEDMAKAIYRKKGIDIGNGSSGYLTNLTTAIQNKDAEYLRGVLGNKDNVASAELFTMVTGIKLASTQRDTLKQIDEWAGITPEQRDSIEAAKDASRAQKNVERDVKDTWDGLAHGRVRSDDQDITTQQYVTKLYSEGYTVLDKTKKGSATIYGVKKEGDSGLRYINNKSFNGFMKAAFAFGGLKKSLDFVGAVIPEAKPKTPVEVVNEAYKFPNASDDFKTWLAEYVDKETYSPFVTAKKMDIEAARNGASIEWGMFGGATLDSVRLAVSELERARDVVVNNAPIHALEGDIEQAALNGDVAQSIEEALEILSEQDDEFVSEDDAGIATEEFALDSAIPSDLGPVFLEYKNDPEGAIERLMQEHNGDARAVWDRADLGEIDLIYGNTKAGLAHIAAKHPEMLVKLPQILKRGKLVRKPGARKVFLVQEGQLPEVAVISLDWYGAAKSWVVTSYVDEQGLFTGSLKTMNTEALDSALVEILFADQRTSEILFHISPVVNGVTLDGVDQDGYVGKISKNGEVVGRVDIGGDGKAMVFVGASGDVRVKASAGQDFHYSDDDAEDMVNALLKDAQSDKSEAQSAQQDIDRYKKLKADLEEGLITPKSVVGGGYKDGRKVANQYLDEMIAKHEAKLAALTASEVTDEPVNNDSHKEIAQTILQQLGGNKFKVMTGAKDFLAMNAEPAKESIAGLRFSLPSNFATNGINRVFIRLNDMDTYDVEFGRARGTSYKVINAESGIYAESLRETFTRFTGLDTSLGNVMMPNKDEAPQVETQDAPAPTEPTTGNPQMDADKALYQSVIDKTVITNDGLGILSPELGDMLEAAYNRHAGNPEMDALLELAANAYADAGIAASSLV